MLTRVLAMMALAAPVLMAQTARTEWIQLFNGKDLKDWTPKIRGFAAGENYANTFRVEDGLLKVRYDQYKEFGERFGHLFYKTPFSYYIIAAEYRFTGDQCPGGPGWATRNGGIMVHGQTPESMGKEQDFPISIEVQLLGGLGKGPRTTANLCTPGTNVERNGKLFTTHCLNSESRTYNGDGWVRVEVEVHGGEMIRHLVDGKIVLDYEKPQIGGGTVSGHDPAVKKDGQILTAGTISLQSESHPVDFRRVELLDLSGCMDKKAKNYKSYFVKNEAARCRY